MEPPARPQLRPGAQIALRIASLYLIFGLVWKLLSDLAVAKLAASRAQFVWYEALKGWFFIAGTAFFLYWLLKRQLASWTQEVLKRTRVEAELESSEDRYRTLFEHMKNGVAHCRMLFDGGVVKDFVYLGVNGSFAQQTGLKDVVGKRATEVIPGIRESDEGLFEAFGQVARTRVPAQFEHYVAALGQWFSFSVFSPAPGEFVTVFDVITERKKAEEELRTFSRAIEQNPASIIITDTAGSILYVNPAFTKITGFSPAEILGKNPRVLQSGKVAPEHYKEMWDTILSGREWVGEFCNRKKSGELYWERASVSPVFGKDRAITHFVAVKTDITEQRELQEQARRSQRLDAVGSLAGGIAHDLNNILAPVLLAPDLLRPSLSSPQDLQLLAVVEQSAQRAKDIVKHLLLFSRGSRGEHVLLVPGRLLDEIRMIISETFRRDIAVTVRADADLYPVIGDPTQLHQVLLNLCVNARDAMPDGGTLTLQVSNTAVDPELSRAKGSSKTGPHVLFTVSDTGVGIPPEITERLFTPFFTTKEVGKGTGLGLSTALGIMRGHGGFITVESLPGEGSTFRVYIPAAQSASNPGAVASPLSAVRGRNELILVGDDEPLIGAATRIVLEGNGYRTLLATRGDAGLAIFRSHADEVALVMTDIMMPVMDGVSMLSQILALRPSVKVVLTTGIDSSEKSTARGGFAAEQVLMKPCKPADLLEAVYRALSTSRT